MKKTLRFLLTFVFLLIFSGCSTSVQSDTFESDIGGTIVDVTLTHKKDKIVAIKQTTSYPMESFATEWTDEIKDDLQENFSQEYADLTDTEGVKATFDFTDTTMEVTLDFDLEKADTEKLKELLGTDFSTLSYEQAAKTFEVKGYTKK
ncbi:uncharacterized lipoprotein YehR (DUF1307 family) [Enterococcus sp. PF1-24]|uniref:DUF1307 domain-containing protein n=1 Tax=unclassified Enterococcus TaxID=2608891 RepID=UPI002476B1DB|nr:MULTISPECIES: DUF1307 domain-containing protein [unclassified Enterococcus]MDH6364878.1 uncharacterized lipoprotein YehR (DUF1307 family) [Enterococcus sp. PFB1-1]MDH6401979.1 uncharacterized lipoprotein YehR (DUF1307 family) [Enterococcus sp. PF1-24]